MMTARDHYQGSHRTLKTLIVRWLFAALLFCLSQLLPVQHRFSCLFVVELAAGLTTIIYLPFLLYQTGRLIANWEDAKDRVWKDLDREYEANLKAIIGSPWAEYDLLWFEIWGNGIEFPTAEALTSPPMEADSGSRVRCYFCEIFYPGNRMHPVSADNYEAFRCESCPYPTEPREIKLVKWNGYNAIAPEKLVICEHCGRWLPRHQAMQLADNGQFYYQCRSVDHLEPPKDELNFSRLDAAVDNLVTVSNIDRLPDRENRKAREAYLRRVKKQLYM